MEMVKIRGEELRRITVCIDSYENAVLAGRLYHPCQEEGAAFQSATQFLNEVEKILDAMEFPKAFSTTRSFLPVPSAATGPPGKTEKGGDSATFAIRILFRQNASWQGSIVWLEGRQEQSFRSVLELLMLMDNALGCKAAS